jgi:hypothetical protein
VGISHNGRVTIRFNQTLAHARVGEEFRDRDRCPLSFTLKSVDVVSGRVVINGFEYALTVL